jgi:DNA helicase-2/ATP-dependent DNA helicase PcrA
VRYQSKYKYIQVDEAQDTSKVQHEIIKLLGSKNNNVFYVADDDQSIYGFRGAYPEFLLNIKDIYENVKIFFMEENFRSTQDIVSVCNQLIKKNNTRFNKNIFTNNSSYQPIQILTVKNKEEQLIDVVEKLGKSKENNTAAVLYRNNISAVLLSDMLSKAGISYKLKGFKKNFFEHWMLSDLLFIINVALNNKDIESFEKIYYKLDGNYISKDMITAIKNIESNATIFEKLLSLPLESYQETNILKLIYDFKIVSNKKIRDMFDYIEYYLVYNRFTDSN